MNEPTSTTTNATAEPRKYRRERQYDRRMMRNLPKIKDENRHPDLGPIAMRRIGESATLLQRRPNDPRVKFVRWRCENRVTMTTVAQVTGTPQSLLSIWERGGSMAEWRVRRLVEVYGKHGLAL